MASVLALLSKSFFESKVEVDGRTPTLGEVAPLDRYFSTNKRFENLKGGGSLYLVTVRNPGEKLWLVAVLDDPTFETKWWRSQPGNQIAITDISDLTSRLKFDNGKGISAAPGRLGMSLQTPRILSDDDVALLDGAAGRKKAPTFAAASGPIEAVAGDIPEGLIHLNAHESNGLPCLCKRCFDPELATATAGGGASFVRDFAVAGGRILYYWLPEQLARNRRKVSSDVAAKLRKRFG